jgi:hypothetical protein
MAEPAADGRIAMAQTTYILPARNGTVVSHNKRTAVHEQVFTP